MIQQLKQANLLSGIKGLVFGRFQKKSEITDEDLRFILNNIFENINFPVLSNVDFSHTDQILSLPLGREVVIDANKLEIEILLKI
jgi:muramoyltetrapeptide carboxypeptidase